jgi:hypothetical protein
MRMGMAPFVSGIMGPFSTCFFALVKYPFYAGFLIRILSTLFPWRLSRLPEGESAFGSWTGPLRAATCFGTVRVSLSGILGFSVLPFPFCAPVDRF